MARNYLWLHHHQHDTQTHPGLTSFEWWLTCLPSIHNGVKATGIAHKRTAFFKGRFPRCLSPLLPTLTLWHPLSKRPLSCHERSIGSRGDAATNGQLTFFCFTWRPRLHQERQVETLLALEGAVVRL